MCWLTWSSLVKVFEAFYGWCSIPNICLRSKIFAAMMDTWMFLVAYDILNSFDGYLVCPDEYVICLGCKSPDTILSKENRLFFLRCEQVIYGPYTLWLHCFFLSISQVIYIKEFLSVLVFALFLVILNEWSSKTTIFNYLRVVLNYRMDSISNHPLESWMVL